MATETPPTPTTDLLGDVTTLRDSAVMAELEAKVASEQAKEQ